MNRLFFYKRPETIKEKLIAEIEHKKGKENIRKTIEMISDKKKELKPCPFCGGEAEVDYRLGVCSVFCKGCGARVSSFGDVNPAVDAWNTRNYTEKHSNDLPDTNSMKPFLKGLL